ncbi:MAG TPA: type VI secretion system baseplate subunit TssF [Gemmatales bacterium]|nr:type VI secretion system baseplate subunit TssF [Gemmatales bacterium]
MSMKKDHIWPYYDRELRQFREHAREFASRYKIEAAALGLGVDRYTDPHIERMIESFALLTARVRAKLDDDFPELIDGMLGVLYPHLLAPIPSMGIVQFDPIPGAAGLEKGLTIGAGSLMTTKDVPGIPCACKYQTAYPVTLWPVEISEASLQSPPYPSSWKLAQQTSTSETVRAKAILRLVVNTRGGVSWAELPLERLRLFLWGDDILTASLHELMLNQVLAVSFRDLSTASSQPMIPLPVQEAIQPVGLKIDEGMLPYPPQSFLGYRLITEFFVYREKFLFLDLLGWAKARQKGAIQSRSVEVLFYLNRTLPSQLEREVGPAQFRLGATPIINLFEQKTEAITLNLERYDYPVIPDVHARSAHEVVSIKDVRHVDPVSKTETEYAPFYSYRHADRDRNRAYWHARRKGTKEEAYAYGGTEVDLHFVNLDFDPRLPIDPTVVVTTLCCNRDLPNVLREVGEALAFEPLAALPAYINCLKPVTSTLRPLPGRGSYWRLISHLNLNHLSLTDHQQGKKAFQEYLELYNFADPETNTQLAKINQQVISGILELESKRTVELVHSVEGMVGFARGMEITIELDEEKFVGLGSYLFAGVLDHYFAMHTSINSYTRLVHGTRQSGPGIKRWPIRCGTRELI